MPKDDITASRENVALTLALLFNIDQDEAISQRRLSSRIGVALGMANAMLRRCTEKGLVKVKQAPAKRYAYYLTPKGFTEKSRLIREYIQTSLDFFRVARSQYGSCFASLGKHEANHVCFFGCGELAEIALLSAGEHEVKPVAIIAPGQNIPSYHGIPVLRSLDEFVELHGEPTLCVITDRASPEASYHEACDRFGAQMVVAPQFMHISKHGGRT